MSLFNPVSRIDVLKVLLEDDIVQTKYGLTKDEIEQIDLTSHHHNDFVALLQQATNLIEGGSLTENTAASNLNSFLDNRLG
ncbi:hypothetical protein RT717_18485 [Imperialibacter roseus]|uniref:Uncharacterized protein n=1 Tax=Imperialibacter roseus TaxID=1324217 RepID=A0ABZ0IJ64_9BACT|nr:hypothetical protein [Imperialibacter roseus]WOK05073.1 hypothetical protein RT717_18485 [Imperialibacter roseus]